MEIYDIYGLTEVYGPGIGIPVRDGITAACTSGTITYVEVIDPDTGAFRA